jgi:phosphoribosylformylglycinamidine (FGAM) synthase-like amidotransferase family enzyme
VLKSTGVKILDDSAACAFVQWKAKPNRLDHAVVPANFTGSPEKTAGHIKDSEKRLGLSEMPHPLQAFSFVDQLTVRALASLQKNARKMKSIDACPAF